MDLGLHHVFVDKRLLDIPDSMSNHKFSPKIRLKSSKAKNQNPIQVPNIQVPMALELPQSTPDT